jgi:hypothetical protein
VEQRELERLARRAQALADALRRAAEAAGEAGWVPIWRQILTEIADQSGGTGRTTISHEREVLRRHLSDPRLGMRLFREGYLVRHRRGPVKLGDPVEITEKGWSLIRGT